MFKTLTLDWVRYFCTSLTVLPAWAHHMLAGKL
jgi:hypothetical protein